MLKIHTQNDKLFSNIVDDTKDSAHLNFENTRKTGNKHETVNHSSKTVEDTQKWYSILQNPLQIDALQSIIHHAFSLSL